MMTMTLRTLHSLEEERAEAGLPKGYDGSGRDCRRPSSAARLDSRGGLSLRDYRPLASIQL